MSSLYQPRPVLSTQRFSPPGSDYIDARRNGPAASYHNTQSATRPPLRDTTGNAQAHSSYNPSHNNNNNNNNNSSSSSSHGLGSTPSNSNVVSCYQGPLLSPSLPTNIPAIVPSQSFDCLYRMPEPRQQPRYARRSKHGTNPLYFWPAFRQYRNRQAHKDNQKDKGGVWRRAELEDAFVDAVLLMPHMGRRKFSMGGKLHGRNMLISEYIFVICVAVLGSKEIFRIDNSNDSIEQMGRKQVSSHMQVVKKFFEDLRCFHFLFPAEEKKEPGSTNSDDYYDDEEQESFKSNPVLTALAEGRVPEVKPNYDYFSTLLALQSGITVRPKTCEVFVSSPDIRIRDEIAYDANNTPLDQASFPHLNKYSNCEDSPNVLGKDVLLHEYTRSLDRTTSACAKTVTRRWQRDAPEMYESLDLPTRDEECLLIEMCATLELHEHAKFPSGSELTGFVEVAVPQLGQQHHRWKCVTRLTRPEELHGDGDEVEMYTNESGIHRPGCSDSRPDCECHLRPRPDIHVPFPAVEWASILSMAVQYPDIEHQRKKDRRGKLAGEDSKKRPDLERTSSKRKRSEDEGDASTWARREPTGSDLICKVAMYQELWSCAPDSTRWTRQAILFWRFNTTNQWFKYNAVVRPAGTSWRWLTINDPMSRYHQQRALVHPSVGVGRDAIMSPTPTIGQHLAANMNETFNTWDNGVSLSHHIPSIQPPPPSNLSIFDSFSNGLATPPPTAGLHSSYPSSSYDPTVSNSTNGAGTSFLPSSAADTPQSAGLPPPQAYYDAAGPSYTESKPLPGSMVHAYISTTSPLDLGSSQLVYDNTDAVGPSSLQGWDISALDNWSAGGNGNSNAATGPSPGAATTTSGSSISTQGTGSTWSTAPTATSGQSQSQSQTQQHQTGGSQPSKLEPAAGIWPGQWAPAPAPVSASSDRDTSPRDAKRRRTSAYEGSQIPGPSVW